MAKRSKAQREWAAQGFSTRQIDHDNDIPHREVEQMKREFFARGGAVKKCKSAGSSKEGPYYRSARARRIV